MGDYVEDGAAAEAYLQGTQQLSKAWQDAADAWPTVGERLKGFMLGSSSSDTSGLDGLINALMDKWKGKAADEFKAKADIVRQFGVDVAGRASNAVNASVYGSQLPPSMQYELMSPFDFVKTAQTVTDMLTNSHSEYQSIEFQKGRYDQWGAHASDVVGFLFNNDVFGGGPRQWAMPTFEEFLHGARAFQSTTREDGTVGLDYDSKPSANCSAVLFRNDGNWFAAYFDYRSDTVSFHHEFNFGLGDSDDTRKDVFKNLCKGGGDVRGEYYEHLRTMVQNLGSKYQTVKPPDPVDDSHLPKGGGKTTTTYPSGPGGGLPYGDSPYSSPYGDSTYPDGSGLDGYDPSASGSGYDPGDYGPGASDPNGYDPGSDLGGYDPYSSGQLAGLGSDGGPGAGGGLFTPGADSGLGASSGLGGGTGGLGGAPGAAATDAAGIAAAGRGMPMAPGAGAGGGKEGRERQRQSWLTEDDDVWGSDTDAPGGVL